MTEPHGAVDDYFPDNGDPSYEVRHYDLHLGYKLETNQLHGRAVLEAAALDELDRIHVDLRGFRVTKVTVDVARVSRYSVKRGKLVIRTDRVIGAGESFTVSITYNGRPRPIPDGDDEMGWEELDDGVIVAGQTNGAPSWFPCNDRPGNKASYTIAVTAPSDYCVIANGVLTERRRGAGSTTWTYSQAEPMASYLATVQIGRYVTRTVQPSPVPITAAMPERHLRRYESAFGDQPMMLTFFTKIFGAYPFQSYSVVITDDELDIPLEAQGLSVFGSNFLSDDWEAVRLVAHELAHQWFGNSLTVTSWRDIWLHEGFACYSEWLWSEESGSDSAHDRALRHWGGLTAKPQDLLIGDPGRDSMFDDRVYKRGALFLHALRLTIGDETFFALLRTWVERNRFGSVSTPMFLRLAEEVAGVPATDLARAWLFEESLPDLPPER